MFSFEGARGAPGKLAQRRQKSSRHSRVLDAIRNRRPEGAVMILCLLEDAAALVSLALFCLLLIMVCP